MFIEAQKYTILGRFEKNIAGNKIITYFCRKI